MKVKDPLLQISINSQNEVSFDLLHVFVHELVQLDVNDENTIKIWGRIGPHFLCPTQSHPHAVCPWSENANSNPSNYRSRKSSSERANLFLHSIRTPLTKHDRHFCIEFLRTFMSHTYIVCHQCVRADIDLTMIDWNRSSWRLRLLISRLLIKSLSKTRITLC